MATEKRLIDANKPIKETESIINFRMCHNMPTEDYESFLNYLKKQPTVDAVEVVHGRWDKNWSGDNIVYCDQCYMPQDVPTPYCASCGAKMDGDGNG